jgi:hypothetical protein
VIKLKIRNFFGLWRFLFILFLNFIKFCLFFNFEKVSWEILDIFFTSDFYFFQTRTNFLQNLLTFSNLTNFGQVQQISNLLKKWQLFIKFDKFYYFWNYQIFWVFLNFDKFSKIVYKFKILFENVIQIRIFWNFFK